MKITDQEGLLITDQYYMDTKRTCCNASGLRELVQSLQKELEEANKKDNLWKGVSHNLGFGIYFRGESKNHDHLLPSIGRLDKKSNEPSYTRDQERNMLHRFRRQSYSHYQRILTDWETIFLARHHLLPTRLIDWTANYLVALYWACENEKNSEEDGAVWAFVRQPDEKWDLNVFDAPLYKYKHAGKFRFLVEGVKIIFPFYVSPRMTAQGGLFTIQDDPWTGLEKYPEKHPLIRYGRRNFDIFHIRKWIVAKCSKKAILKDLGEVGINIQTLYPDLEGLGKGIPRSEEIRQEFSFGGNQ